jgi:hypothetical protein
LFKAAEAAGMSEGKLEPKKWAQAPHEKTSGSSGRASVSGGPGRPFIDFVAETLKVNAADVLKATRGKGGGTYAHWQIALAYAKYLSPELHMQVNEIYLRAKSGDVTLADEIADKASPEQQEWLAKRVNSKVARHRLTSTLATHGVSGRGFGDCTNSTYKGLFNGTKKEICAAAGVEYKKGKSLRDVMSIEDLIAVSMAEMVAAKQIDKFNVRGDAPCADECLRSARKVAGLLQ